MTEQTFVIVGGGLAAGKAAEHLRGQGFDGRLFVITAEPERPYERPPLSKDYLRGESERDKAYVNDEHFYAADDVELLTSTRVDGLDAAERRVTLSNGDSISFDKLLLATGAEPRRLDIPGSDLDGIHYLRTFADADAIRERLTDGVHVAVVGAGWIGSEVAASARMRGAQVTLIDPLPLPNVRIFGPEVGAFYRDVHAQHGVELLLGTGVSAFDGEGAVRGVRTSDDRLVECDFAVVGIGVVPRTELAQGAGLELTNGIAVDQALRSSAPNVFAAGDVADAWHPFYERRVRVEHWANALNQGPAAASSMLGEPVSFDRIPYFFSDQYEVGMEYSGYATEWDEVRFRGDPAGGEFVAFWLKDQRVLAGMNVNVWDVNQHVQALIRSRQPVDVAALSDPDTPLETLIGETATSG
jgi:3-phenylpropionate/trans-cinnamate dioxygenase ferredoxin reductase component